MVGQRELMYCETYERTIDAADKICSGVPWNHSMIVDAVLYRMGYKNLFIDPVITEIEELVKETESPVAKARLGDAGSLFGSLRKLTYALYSHSFRDIVELGGIDGVMKLAVDNVRQAADMDKKVVGFYNDLLTLFERITMNEGVIYKGNQFEEPHRLNQVHYDHLGLTMSPIAQGYGIASNMARAKEGSRGTVHWHPGKRGEPVIAEIHMPLPGTTGIHVNSTNGLKAVDIQGHDMMMIDIGARHGYIFPTVSEKLNLLGFITASDPRVQGIWRTVPDAVSVEDDIDMDALRGSVTTDLSEVNAVDLEERVASVREGADGRLFNGVVPFDVDVLRANSTTAEVDHGRETLIVSRGKGRMSIECREIDLEEWDTVVVPSKVGYCLYGDDLLFYRILRAA